MERQGKGRDTPPIECAYEGASPFQSEYTASLGVEGSAVGCAIARYDAASLIRALIGRVDPTIRGTIVVGAMRPATREGRSLGTLIASE